MYTSHREAHKRRTPWQRATDDRFDGHPGRRDDRTARTQAAMRERDARVERDDRGRRNRPS